LELERYISVDALPIFDHCNTASFDDGMTILVDTIAMQLIPVCCKKSNNSTITCWIHPERPALEASNFLNWIHAFFSSIPDCYW
jgi:hypothetical protein